MNLLKTILSTSVFAIASVALHAQLPAKVESFPVRDVRLTASPFKHAEDMDIRYLLGIDPDRLGRLFLLFHSSLFSGSV